MALALHSAFGTCLLWLQRPHISPAKEFLSLGRAPNLEFPRETCTDRKLTAGSTIGSGGFGSASTNTTPFGQNRPEFGAPATTTSGGGLFGGGTATAGASGGFGGFGNTSNNNNASGGGLFGASKPAFGSGTAGGLFGGGNTQNNGFGSTNNQQTSAFGAPVSSALGNNNAECQGTGSTPFQALTEKEGASSTSNHFQSISFMAPYKNFSFEASLRNLSNEHTVTDM